jgi:hypothetical protein
MNQALENQVISKICGALSSLQQLGAIEGEERYINTSQSLIMQWLTTRRNASAVIRYL